MNDVEVYSITIVRMAYSDGKGSKIRPVVLIKFNDETIETYRITSQYDNKSDWIKEKYFEIIDWYRAGLKKPSWIDTVKIYDIDNDTSKIHIIGKLTSRDIRRLQEFLKQR